MSFLLRILRGCRHHFTWPRTDAQGHHYQVCSICGVAYEYDWELMRRTKHVLVPEPHHA